MISVEEIIEYEYEIYQLPKILEETSNRGIDENYMKELKKMYDLNKDRQNFLINYLKEKDIFEYSQFQLYINCYFFEKNNDKKEIVKYFRKIIDDNYGCYYEIESLLKFCLIYLSDEKIKLFLEIIDEEKIEIDIMNDDLVLDWFHSAISIAILMKRNIEIIKLLCIPRSKYEKKNEIINSTIYGRCDMSILMLSIIGSLSKEIIYYLLDNGADPFQEDNNKLNALMCLEISNYSKEDKKDILYKMLCKINDELKITGQKRKEIK
jgi:hypothetical protein